MMQFETIELLFTQLYNLTDEIRDVIVKEAYNEADEKFKSREALLKRIINTIKTTPLTQDDEQKLNSLEAKFKQMEEENVLLFEKIRDEFKEKLKETNKHVKVNSAYTITAEENPAIFYDLTEG